MEIIEFRAFRTSKGVFSLDCFDNEEDMHSHCQQIAANGYLLVSKINEGQADSIVDFNEEKQYYYKYPHRDWQGDISALESFHCLVRHNGFDPNEKNLYIFQLAEARY